MLIAQQKQGTTPQGKGGAMKPAQPQGLEHTVGLAILQGRESTMEMGMSIAPPEGGGINGEQPSIGHRRRLRARSSSLMSGATGSVYGKGAG